MSKKPTTPWSHLRRLAILLVVFFVGALFLKEWATPADWNYEGWYREGAISDVASQPLAFGGNESCESCHQKASKKIRKLAHRGLSCESCHGALADHVKADKKFALAKVDKSNWQCLNCHAEQINRPKGFPQYSEAGEIGKLVRKHKDIKEAGKKCLKCHDAHDPKP